MAQRWLLERWNGELGRSKWQWCRELKLAAFVKKRMFGVLKLGEWSSERSAQGDIGAEQLVELLSVMQSDQWDAAVGGKQWQRQQRWQRWQQQWQWKRQEEQRVEQASARQSDQWVVAVSGKQ